MWPSDLSTSFLKKISGNFNIFSSNLTDQSDRVKFYFTAIAI